MLDWGLVLLATHQRPPDMAKGSASILVAAKLGLWGSEGQIAQWTPHEGRPQGHPEAPMGVCAHEHTHTHTHTGGAQAPLCSSLTPLLRTPPWGPGHEARGCRIPGARSLGCPLGPTAAGLMGRLGLTCKKALGLTTILPGLGRPAAQAPSSDPHGQISPRLRQAGCPPCLNSVPAWEHISPRSPPGGGCGPHL